MMESDGLSDLLQQAEQLTAEMESGADLPRVERNLTQIMEVGQRLWTRTAQTIHDSTDVKASILLGSKGFDIPKISQKLESLSAAKTFEPLEPVRDTDIQGFLRNERENALLAVIEQTRKNTFLDTAEHHWSCQEDEWEREKQKILNSLASSGQDGLDFPQENESRFSDTINMRTRSCMDHVEMAYSRQVYIYNDEMIQHGLRKSLADMCQLVGEKLDDKNIVELWSMVKYMTQIPTLTTGSTIAQTRSTKQLQEAFVRQARRYLEESYKKYIQSTISANLQQAKLGGLPGTYSMVKSFLNVRLPNNTPGLEDGLVDGHPIWAMVYYCLRCGDLKAALQVVQKAPQSLGDFSAYIQEYASGDERLLSPSSRTDIHLQYKRSVRIGSDPYKRALYCLVGSCDPNDSHPDIADKIDDYLWLKLCQLDLDADEKSLNRFQKLLLEEYGESHFNAFQQPLVYFEVLFLTAQFEAAISFLAQIDKLRCHAVHIALCLYELKLLALPNTVHSQLLTMDPVDESPMRRLNFSLLIRMYTRRFESTDPREALQYFYYLRDVKERDGESVFMKCVSELVLETREFDMLLGRLERDGARRPGAIDKFDLDTMKIIQMVAKDCEEKGQFEDAVKLYDLSKNAEKVLELLNKLLVPVLSQPPVPQSTRDRLRTLAVSVAERYQSSGLEGSRSTTGTFYKLLDLMTFFDLHHSNQFDQAVMTMSQLKLLPLTVDTVEAKVNAFKYYTDEIRRALPDVLLAVMNILYSQYKKARGTGLGSPMQRFSAAKEDGGKDSYLDHLRQQARALITFAGMIPYRMPGDTNSRLVQLEVLMN